MSTTPTNFRGHAYGRDEVHLSWFNPGNEWLAFSIERRQQGTSTWTVLPDILPQSYNAPKGDTVLLPTECFSIVAGLAQGTIQEFRIRAYDINGYSAYSSTITVNLGVTVYYVSTTGSDANNGLGTGSAWRTHNKAFTSNLPAGSLVIAAAGTYDEPIMEIPVGVSYKGAGANQTIVRNSVKDWSRSCFNFSSGSATSGNQTFNGFTLDGNNFGGFSGANIKNRSHVWMRNFEIRNFILHGIQLLNEDMSATLRGVEIANFTIKESAKEDTGYSSGNIWGKGDWEDVRIHDGTIEHLTNVVTYSEPTFTWKSSGYAIKWENTYGSTRAGGDYFKKSRIYKVTERGKPDAPWNNYTAPMISFELRALGTSGIDIYACSFTTHISLEFPAPVKSGDTYSVRMRWITIKPIKQQAIEWANNQIILKDSVIDYRDTYNAYEIFGEYNTKPGILGGDIVGNIFLLGNNRPAFFANHNRPRGFRIWGNTIYGTGTAGLTIWSFRTNNNQQNVADFDIINNIFDLDGDVRVAEWINSASAQTWQGTNRLRNNFLRTGRSFTSVPGNWTNTGNLTGTPGLKKTGNIPFPFLEPTDGSSNVVNAGFNVGTPFSGAAPEIGAYELGAVSGGNQLPNISITSPTEGQQFVANANITLVASASDPDGSVASVEFFRNGVSVGTVNAAPFQITLNNQAAGSYSYTAKVTDNAGATRFSSAVSVTVRGANVAPACSLVTPVANQQYPTGSQVLIQADATDSDGTVTKVEFFAGATKIGEALQAPWAINWQPSANGTYNITARATDNDGAQTTSAARSITVATLQSAFYRGYNLNGAALAVSGKSLQANDDTIIKSGIKWANPGPGNPNLSPAPDANTEAALRTFLASNSTTPAIVEIPVPNGQYLVSVAAFEDNNAESFDLLVQDVKVLENHLLNGNGAAGQWQLLGPFTANVTNGILKIEGRDGAMNMSYILIDSVGGTVDLNLSASNNQVVVGQTVTLSALATLPAGVTISKIEFFAGATKLGEDTNSPYSFAWTPAAGSYSVSARLTDTNGNVYVSNVITVTVAAANQPPAASLQLSASSINANGSVGFAVTASDDSGLTKVEIFAGTLKVAEQTISQQNGQPVLSGVFNLNWQNIPAGSYSVTARVTDQGGLTVTTSASVLTVTVPAPVPVSDRERYAYKVLPGGYYLIRNKRKVIS